MLLTGCVLVVKEDAQSSQDCWETIPKCHEINVIGMISKTLHFTVIFHTGFVASLLIFFQICALSLIAPLSVSLTVDFPFG